MHDGGFGGGGGGEVPVEVVVIEVPKAAVTLRLPVIVNTQPPVPEQAPLQPENVDPDEAVAVSVTLVPGAKLLEHVPGHEMPVGLLVTLPDPDPPTVTVSAGGNPKVAVTLRSELIVTVQAPVPEQPPPLQPANVDPADGLAVSVTIDPAAKPLEHVVGHEIPCGALVTVPVPAPASVTVKVFLVVNVAVTL